MKKATIKRRKRVVPAYNSDPKTTIAAVAQRAATALDDNDDDEMAFIESELTTTDRQLRMEPEEATSSHSQPPPKRRRPPPDVDFTGYRPDDLVVSAAVDAPGPSTSLLQRAASAAERTMQLDPALLNDDPPVERGEGGGGGGGGRVADRERDQAVQRAGRRAQLLLEAEEMRERLRAKEREIEELG